MKLKILLAVIVTSILLGIIATVTKASNTVQLQQIDLKTKEQEIEIKTKKSEELQLRLDKADGNLKELKEVEKENKKLQDEIKALQAKKAEKERLAKAKQKTIAQRALNAVTHTQTAYASTGSCADWIRQAGITDVASANELIRRESNCNASVINPSSGSCGVAQELPCGKSGCQLGDGACQVRWMKSYVEGRYGSFSAAVQWHNSHNWY